MKRFNAFLLATAFVPNLFSTDCLIDLDGGSFVRPQEKSANAQPVVAQAPVEIKSVEARIATQKLVPVAAVAATVAIALLTRRTVSTQHIQQMLKPIITGNAQTALRTQMSGFAQNAQRAMHSAAFKQAASARHAQPSSHLKQVRKPQRIS